MSTDPMAALRGDWRNVNPSWLDRVTPTDCRGHFVYSLCDEDGRPVYIGMTGNLRQRLAYWRSAARYRSWGPEWSGEVKTKRARDAEHAQGLEAWMIATWQPPGNRQRPEPPALEELVR